MSGLDSPVSPPSFRGAERRSFEDFCLAMQTYPRPLTELGKHQRFVNKRHHNQWSVAHVGKEPSVEGSGIVHGFRVHYANIPMEPLITVTEPPGRTKAAFNQQVATAARGAFGRAFAGTRRRWSPRLW